LRSADAWCPETQEIQGSSQADQTWKGRSAPEPCATSAPVEGLGARAIASAANAVAFAGLDGVLTQVNPAFLSLWGYDTEAEVLGRPAESFWRSPQEAGQVREQVARAGRCLGEMDAVRKDGSVFRVQFGASLVRSEAGEPLSLMSSFVDVTERTEALRALQESERRLRVLFEAMHEGFALHEIIWDEAGAPVDYRFLEVNPAFERLTGLERRMVVGRSAREMLPHLEPLWLERYAEVVRTGLPQRFQAPAADLGRDYDVQAYRPAPGQFVAVFSDVTDRYTAEVAARESETRYRETVDLLPQTVFETDAQGRLIFVNRQAYETFGYSPEDFSAGLTPMDFLVPEDRERARENIVRILQGRGRTGSEYTGLRKDGTRFPVMVYSAPILKDGAPHGLRGTVFDVSERVRAEEERRRLESQLQQSQKLESLGVLAGGIAHDFNNLLTPILGHAELAGLRLGDDHPVAGELRSIVTAAERAGNLTQQILAFSRKQVLQPRVIDLNGEVATVERMLRRVIGEDVEIRLHLDLDLGPVEADPVHIQQVLMNLAVNARDAMPRGGVIRLETGNVTLGEARPGHRPDLPAGEYVALTVADTGDGMTPEVMRHIFEPFFTTKEQGRGTGLGLATVHGIVKQHGGDVTVESAPGSGTAFRVYLPRIAAAVEEQEAERRPAGASGKETVLLVEDEPMVRELTQRILAEHGYDVVAAEDGHDALRAAAECRAPIDLLLTDVVMPGPCGPEVYRALAATRPELRVLYMSGYPAGSGSLEGLLEPGEPLLVKPFSLSTLISRVGEILHRPAVEAQARRLGG